jgi:hypothetical protein
MSADYDVGFLEGVRRALEECKKVAAFHKAMHLDPQLASPLEYYIGADQCQTKVRHLLESFK